MKRVVNFFKCVLLISFLYFTSILNAQDNSAVVWGDIPREDLEMKSFPADTNASALILYDFGETTFNNDFEVEFRRHLRIKIFNAKGYEWGTQSITLHTEDNIERISDIEGCTYSLDENGTVQTSSLKQEDIFEEAVTESRTKYKFTLPQLKPGCVIEIRYKTTATSFFYVNDWYFQTSEPTRWSEYIFRFPKEIGYSLLSSGFEPFYIYDFKDVTQVFTGKALNYVDNNVETCHQKRWVVKDAPAIRDEPYITTANDYYSRVEIQATGYSFHGITKQLLHTWDSLVEELCDNDMFGEMIDDNGTITDLAKDLTKGLSSDEDKLKAIYKWVSSSIVTTPSNSIFAHKDLDDILEEKKGNNAEVTFLLLSLLKSVGIDGDPVITSTRSYGSIQEILPMLSQFNYVLARVKIGSNSYFVSANDALRPIELLPLDLLNSRGLVVNKEKREWVNLTSNKKYGYLSTTNMVLNEDGSIKGTFSDTYYDYANLVARHLLKEKDNKELAEEFFDKNKNGIEVDSLITSDKEQSYSPLNITADFKSDSYAQAAGDIIYINPIIIHRVEENPFKSNKRKFPVDYPFEKNITSIVNLTIPEGFDIKETIGNKSTQLSPSTVTYKRFVERDNNVVHIRTNMEIKQTRIDPKLYEQLRYFYTTLVAAESEQLVLVRKPTISGDQQGAVPSNNKGGK